MTIRVWLVGFGLLFVSVELLDWALQIGSSQPVGYWTVLGGLGLAAASNARHLPKRQEAKSNLGNAPEESVDSLNTLQTRANPPKAGQSDAKSLDRTLDKSLNTSSKGTDRSDDSISFRVRLPWR